MNKPLFSAARHKDIDEQHLAEAIITLAYADKLTPEQKQAVKVLLARLDTLEATLSKLAKDMKP